MGRLLLLVLCLISAMACSLSTRAAALCEHGAGGLRRGLEEQSMRGRLLGDDTAGGAAVSVYWSPRVLHSVANFTIGTPPQPVSGFIDLSGELVWTQCAACGGCFEQELPLFNTSASSTYRAEPCGSTLCKSIPTSSCSGYGECGYVAPSKLGDTFGIAGTDTVAIGTAKGRLAFGCVEESKIDAMWGPSGFVGLGRTPWSLVAQTNATAFSYCLAPHGPGKSSKLFLGSSAKLAGGKSNSTPFVNASGSPDDGSDPDYKVQLEGIKAGDVAILSPPNGTTVVLDTFSPFSFLVDGAHQVLKKVAAAALGAPAANPLRPFDLCIENATVSNAPELVLTFQGAAALTVPPSSYLLDVGNGTVCLSILSSARLNLTDGVSILGSLQQENVHFLFDLDKKTLSFQPANCSSLS
ncbi:aspartic proteinase nepenthesin-1-like [Oryza brachyantha]|uniref:Peptidase A1 domain-containing protein n=1 Tax=Oryza brachyantha TaxID=4533 RepID=J3N4H1_ORYBR|nr:aspartic proteinase nepenthesin-1-like [Oryza brachyantha]